MAGNEMDLLVIKLDQLSTDALEELLRADIFSPDHDDEDYEDHIFRILEVIERREQEHPTGLRIPDVDKAWDDFWRYYNIPEGDGLSLCSSDCTEEKEGQSDAPGKASPNAGRPFKLTRAFVRGAAVAAVLGVLFAGMVAVQAFGLDVFGAIARWTNTSFQFALTQADSNTVHGDPLEVNEYTEVIRLALRSMEIEAALAPTRFPEGYVMTELTTYRDMFFGQLHVTLKSNVEGKEEISIDIRQYRNPEDIQNEVIEKDETPVTLYTSNERNFYFLNNMGVVGARWSNNEGELLYICGRVSEEEIKDIIDSIGG